MNLNIIILAAGQGTRMKSSLPKVLHPVGGVPMVSHVINSAKTLNANKIIMVYGHGGELLQNTINDSDLLWVEQQQQLGTGHAVQQTCDFFDDDATVMILYGDVPLITPKTLTALADAALGDSDTLALLTMNANDPSGYGRIIRDDNHKVLAITEEKDASEAEKLIQEVNTGFLAVKGTILRNCLSQLHNNNAQGEYYLTDIIGFAAQQNININTVQADTEYEVLGVNSKMQLAYLERCLQQRLCEELMQQGVTLIDPARVDIRGSVTIGKDVTIDVNVVFEGEVSIGDNSIIGANCVIVNSKIGTDVTVLPMCHFEDAIVGNDCRIGPYSRLRPGAELTGNNHIGNFVEVKKSIIGLNSKVNHLTYIGDTDMGQGVNIGAGTITANYDGANKHRTTIGDNASTGSNSVLVAPVKVGKAATIGAGTVLTTNAPEGELTLARAKQKSISNWKRPIKKK